MPDGSGGYIYAETIMTAIPGVGENGDYVVEGFIFRNGRNSSSRASGLHGETNNITVRHCKFLNCEGASYGSAYLKPNQGASKQAIVEWCEFRHGRAKSPGGQGGGLRLEGLGRVSHCIFEDNWAEKGTGGGLCIPGGDVDVLNSLFYGSNKALCTGGGGIYVGGGASAFIQNSTVADNYALTKEYPSCAHGGGLYAEGNGTSVTVLNSIFWGNTLVYLNADPETGEPIPDEVSEIETDGTATVATTYSIVRGIAETNGNKNQDPQFILTYRIPDGSPGHNAGDPSSAVWDLDLDREWRLIGSYVDMGINEVQVGACCHGDGTCSDVAPEDCEYVCDVAALLPPSFTGCFADADGSGLVNASDRGFIAANIGQTAYDLICMFDLDGNGVINASDRGFVSVNIGLCSALPDYQDGSGLNGGVADPRFHSVANPGTSCSVAECTPF